MYSYKRDSNEGHAYAPTHTSDGLAGTSAWSICTAAAFNNNRLVQDRLSMCIFSDCPTCGRPLVGMSGYEAAGVIAQKIARVF